MKTMSHKNVMTFFLLGGLTLAGAQAFAQDALLQDTESILNSDQIDIDGVYAEKKRPSVRDRLEVQNNQMVQKKIENIRNRQEQKLSKQLRKAFSGNLQDSISTSQSATKTVVASAPVVVVKALKRNKVIPYAGVKNISGEGLELESSFNGGLQIENEITQRFSVGFGFNYTTLKASDLGNNTNSYFISARDMDYKRVDFEVNSKMFLIKEGTVRPYAGLGLSYSRHNLKYVTNQQFGGTNSYYGYNSQNIYNTYAQNGSLDNEIAYSSSFVAASLTVGSEVNFSETIGMNVEFKYNRGISQGYNTKASQTYQSSDEVSLNNIGAAIEEANTLSINAGLLIRF